ncbi:MAG TPA: hypothetical protein VK762_31530 [Polyangiaceae bacterium]|nr:hypothetical protein [Polyangiaceae bacterium]
MNATLPTRCFMFRTVMLLATVGLIGFASPTARADETPGVGPHAQPLMSGEHMGKIREEARLHEQRAHELEPIIARDRQARHDVEVDWAVLERHARDLHSRAVDFRAYAGEASGRGQNDLNTFANELESFAAHDEENARMQHEMADRLDRAIQSASMMRDWHLKMAQRLRDWLGANGG